MHQPVSVPLARSRFGLDPALTFLNHGSYGAVPTDVLRYQSDMRARMERDPVRFYKHDLEHLMDDMRARVGKFLGCPGPTLAPMVNATVAIATVLANLELKGAFQAGDEILITDHEYMSGVNELERICARTGAVIVKAPIPFPIQSPQQVIDSIASRLTRRTKFAMISWITSATSLIFPMGELVALFRDRGVTLLVDGTHAPGQIPVDIAAMNPDFWVGSGHKWMSAPKGTGVLYVPEGSQGGFRTVCLSSRAHKVRPERPLFLRDFDYMGTDDYSGILSVPAAIDSMGSMLPGGWPELYARNHKLVIEGLKIVCNGLGVEPPAPESMIGTMATVKLPEPPAHMLTRPTKYDDALQDELVDRHGVVVPIWRLSSDNSRVLRISAQVYNTVEEYHKLTDALVEELRREGSM